MKSALLVVLAVLAQKYIITLHIYTHIQTPRSDYQEPHDHHDGIR